MKIQGPDFSPYYNVYGPMDPEIETITLFYGITLAFP